MLVHTFRCEFIKIQSIKLTKVPFFDGLSKIDKIVWCRSMGVIIDEDLQTYLEYV